MSRRSLNNGKTHNFARAAAASATDECIVWPFATTQGYGAMAWDGRSIRASRLVLILATGGPPSAGRWDAAHAPGICHNRACVNPRHLRWATPAENNADRWIDKTVPLGEDHHLTTLTADQVQSVYDDERPTEEVAAEYGISTTSVRNIRAGVTWSHMLPKRRRKPRIKLSDADVEAIKLDPRNQCQIARSYGVLPSTINKIVNGSRRTEPSRLDHLARREDAA